MTERRRRVLAVGGGYVGNGATWTSRKHLLEERRRLAQWGRDRDRRAALRQRDQCSACLQYGFACSCAWDDDELAVEY